MNLHELNQLIEAVKNDKQLYDFYVKKRAELINKINKKIKNELTKIN
jgi:hypothetical protein